VLKTHSICSLFTVSSAVATTVLAVGLAALCNVAVAADFPPGTYEARDLSVTFDGKGQYTLSQGGILKVSGTYTVQGDEIDVTDKTGPWTCPKDKRTGSYHWQTTLTGLEFSKIADECEGRSVPMTTGSWKHKT
jgi:hypothetical protein